MNLIKNIPVSSFMTRELTSIHENALMLEAGELFKISHFHHLPVINEDKKIVGVISDRDYKQMQHHFTILGLDQAKESNEAVMSSIMVKEVMQKNPICLNPDDSISDAVELLLKHDIHSVIITDKGTAIGILTTYDILKRIVDPALID